MLPIHTAPPSAASPPKLLDQVRTAIRLRHYSPRTEQAYVSWLRRFIVFHGKRHPRELGAALLSRLRGVTWLMASLFGHGGWL